MELNSRQIESLKDHYELLKELDEEQQIVGMQHTLNLIGVEIEGVNA